MTSLCKSSAVIIKSADWISVDALLKLFDALCVIGTHQFLAISTTASRIGVPSMAVTPVDEI